eukprot:TRINITY_DN13228_c0_g1_i1.p1 TRINITY_DN13228_c0_g1~~TRINITY_DN13228_c0_g1_i1.p1  ORF type:complete len:252 (-),score=38.07 TRINITY_DN13228_c0_g1_i1:53-745(-)
MRGLFLLCLFISMCLACTSNIQEVFEQGLAVGTDPSDISCEDGVWTVPGDLFMYSGELNVNNDTINVTGAVQFGFDTKLYFEFYTNDSSASGLINSATSMDFGKATMTAQILDPSYLGTIRYVFATYPFATLGQALYSFSVLIAPTERVCRRQSGDTSLNFPDSVSAALTFTLEGNGDPDCSSDKNRQWVLAFFIIAFVWALALIAFVVVTCKVSSKLKNQFWESDYAMA